MLLPAVSSPEIHCRVVETHGLRRAEGGGAAGLLFITAQMTTAGSAALPPNSARLIPFCFLIGFTAGTDASQAMDTALERNAAGAWASRFASC